MVDVGAKAITHREAVACGRILMNAATLELLEQGAHQKGDVLAVARIAGIMGTKRTSDLIPLCHPLALDRVEIAFSPIREPSAVECRVTATTSGKTGVEMEALTGVQIALLTIYDMCKGVDRGMIITDVCLLSKTGGRSGTWKREP